MMPDLPLRDIREPDTGLDRFVALLLVAAAVLVIATVVVAASLGYVPPNKRERVEAIQL